MICTFFGHRDAPATLMPKIKDTLNNLIAKNDVNLFYVGNQGNFDKMVIKALSDLKTEYPKIQYFIVLPYLPVKQTIYEKTIYPEGIENTPPKFAICKRNDWLIEHSDIVVTYAERNFGGAAKYKQLAKRKGKIMIDIQ